MGTRPSARERQMRRSPCLRGANGSTAAEGSQGKFVILPGSIRDSPLSGPRAYPRCPPWERCTWASTTKRPSFDSVDGEAVFPSCELLDGENPTAVIRLSQRVGERTHMEDGRHVSLSGLA